MNNPAITNRKFGIEIEFVGACQHEVARAINATGVNCQTSYYTHRTTSFWKIVPDSSLREIRGYAFELVSPILQGSEGLEQLLKVCEALNSVDGVTVNRSCGLHIHLDAHDLKPLHVKSLMSRYAKYEDQIDSLLPRSRRNTQWARKINTTEQERVKGSTTLQQLARHNRYFKVNLTNLTSRGAIEFRQHSGTTEFKKIANWLSFLMAFVETSKQLAGTGERVRRTRTRVYGEIRDIIEQYGTMVWKGSRWVITINGTTRHFSQPEIEIQCDWYEGGENFARDLVQDFGVSLISETNDQGWLQGVSQNTQDYINERIGELA